MSLRIGLPRLWKNGANCAIYTEAVIAQGPILGGDPGPALLPTVTVPLIRSWQPRRDWNPDLSACNSERPTVRLRGNQVEPIGAAAFLVTGAVQRPLLFGHRPARRSASNGGALVLWARPSRNVPGELFEAGPCMGSAPLRESSFRRKLLIRYLFQRLTPCVEKNFGNSPIFCCVMQRICPLAEHGSSPLRRARAGQL